MRCASGCIDPVVVQAQSLRGSSASLDRQVEQANAHDYTRLRDAAHVQRFIGLGLLVRLTGNSDYEVDTEVSFPYGRSEVKTFVERLSSQYREACGERLVVTSLTRPKSHQPRNASPESVHPAGMAVDLRLPAGRCREWLEGILLYLERVGVLEATRERRPPHYHIAVFGQPYRRHVERLTGQATAGESVVRYQVRAGDSLWALAHEYGVTVGRLQELNNLSGSGIQIGQTIQIPATQHRVRRGDTLSDLAQTHGVSVRSLQELNGLSDDRLRVGQTLWVPTQ